MKLLAVLFGVFLFAIGAVLLVAACLTISNVWGYQDSPDSVYISTGIAFLVLGVLATFGGFKVLGSR